MHRHTVKWGVRDSGIMDGILAAAQASLPSWRDKPTIFSTTTGTQHVRLLFWDPVGQATVANFFAPCPWHAIGLIPTDQWQSDQNHNPRLLYDVGGPVWLVGRYYQCPNDSKKHNVLSTDESILQCCRKAQLEIPFHLTHRAGVTTAFADYVIHR